MKQSSTFQESYINRRAHRRRWSPIEIHDDRSINSTTTGQSLFTDTNNNPYDRKEQRQSSHQAWVGKCYKCSEPKHKSNECSKRRQVNMKDYEERDDMLIETELEDFDFIEEHGDPITCIIQKVLCSHKNPDTMQRH